MSKTGSLQLKRWLSGFLVFSLILSLFYVGGVEPVYASELQNPSVKTNEIDNTFRPNNHENSRFPCKCRLCTPTPYLSSVIIRGKNSVELGHTLKLNISGLMSNGRVANLTGATIEWTVDNANVVNIDNNGLLSAVSKGAAKITVSVILDGKTVSGTLDVTVTETLPKDSLKIVMNRKAKAVLLVPVEKDENIQYAADLLLEYIQKSSGAQLEVKTLAELSLDEESYLDKTKIYLGFAPTGDEDAVNADLEGMDGDGFIIRPGEGSITIIGPTSWGTRFGANDFLERYVGVRWLLPGEDGKYVPYLENIEVASTMIKEQPAFMMRSISPLNGATSVTGPVQYEWGINNRLHSTVEFHHNISTLFPSDEYGVSHPEIYPMRNGVRYIPPMSVTSGWQPRFTERATVDIAIERIIKYFDENPQATSFSLGVNDSGGYCEEELNSTVKINSVGVKDMSDIYYNWANEVVTGVREKYPDKWFGLLAYDYVADPPSFKLDSHIVPFITKDRMTWIDPEVEAVGKAQMENWNVASENIGWYDYIYGLTYTLPRVYSQLMGENYKYAKEHGVSAHYAELYPNWGEGYKPWLVTKLLWNPEQDVNSLVDEWCELAVGADAAPELRQYYDHWENFWTQRVQNSTWFDEYKNTTYLEFGTAGYLDLVTEEDIIYSRNLLMSVKQKANTDKEKARAEMIYRMFEYYEASALSYPKNIEAITTTDAAISILQDGGVIKQQLEMADKRLLLANELLNDSSLKLMTHNPTALGLDWSGWNPKQLFEIISYMKENEKSGGPVTERVKELTQSTDGIMSEFAKLIQGTKRGDNFINPNPGFEEVTLKWSPWVVSRGTISRTEEFSRTGKAALKVTGLDRGGPYQDIAVKPGLMGIQAYYNTPQTPTGNPVIQITVNLKDAAYKDLKVIKIERKALAGTVGKWNELDALIDIPETINGTPVKNARVVILISGLAVGEATYIDDAYIYQIPILAPVSKVNFWSYYDKIKNQPEEYADLYETVRQQAVTGATEEDRNYAKLLLGVLEGNIAQSLKNSSFETGMIDPKKPADWTIIGATGATVERQEVLSLTGAASVKIANLTRGGVYQRVSVQQGLTAIRAHFYSKNPVLGNPYGTYVRIEYRYVDTNGTPIGSAIVDNSSLKRIANTPEQWSQFESFIDVPDLYNGIQVKSVDLYFYVGSMQSGEEIYFDDMELYQLGVQ